MSKNAGKGTELRKVKAERDRLALASAQVGRQMRQLTDQLVEAAQQVATLASVCGRLRAERDVYRSRLARLAVVARDQGTISDQHFVEVGLGVEFTPSVLDDVVDKLMEGGDGVSQDETGTPSSADES